MEYEEFREHEDDSGAQENEEYSFMQETIKDETGSGKRAGRLVLKYVGLGFIFGAAACFSFFALKPLVEEQFAGNPKQVTIQDDENKEIKEVPKEENKIVEETENLALTMEDYQELNRAFYDVVYEVGKSLVEIQDVQSGQEWHNEAYDEKNSIAGVIVFDNGQELLIFGKSSVAGDAKNLTATFADGKTYPAEVKQTDAGLGFSIYSVKRDVIEETTWGQIQTAKLGNSNSVAKGDGIIALGKPFGYYGAVGYGVSASVKNEVVREDGKYGLLCTDISAAENGTGVLANIRGEIVGMIDQTISDKGSMNLITAYGISDIKEVIELMSNDNSVPYIGIIGVTVSEEFAKQQGIPEGIYVQAVKADSPAMEAGIQSGDFITSIDGESVVTLDAYHEELMKRKEGQRMKIAGLRQGAGAYVDIEFAVTIGKKE